MSGNGGSCNVGSYGPHQPSKILSISLAETERLIKKWHGANEGLIEYAVSPRFAVACTEKMMHSAADKRPVGMVSTAFALL